MPAASARTTGHCTMVSSNRLPFSSARSRSAIALQMGTNPPPDGRPVAGQLPRRVRGVWEHEVQNQQGRGHGQDELCHLFTTVPSQSRRPNDQANLNWPDRKALYCENGSTGQFQVERFVRRGLVSTIQWSAERTLFACPRSEPSPKA